MAVFSKTNMFLLALFFFLSSSQAKELLVGGKSNAWKIPSSDSDSLNHWAQKARFRIGDSLVWKYDGSKDSVLEVSRLHYLSCNTSSPIESYADGNTTVKLERSGAYYFISGAKGHCELGQKVIVVVMSNKHRRHISVAPAPSPVEAAAFAPAPTSGAAGLRVEVLVALSLGSMLFSISSFFWWSWID